MGAQEGSNRFYEESRGLDGMLRFGNTKQRRLFQYNTFIPTYNVT
jgi:hypothetical protein